MNLFELWESEEVLAQWRTVADPPAQFTEIVGGDLQKYGIASAGPVYWAVR